MGLFERLLRKLFSHKEIGWEEIGERFTRYTILRTRWFNIYLHQLYAPIAHSQCHDHPWSFIAVLLRGGYYEFAGKQWVWQPPGRILYRPATFRHNVVTKGQSISWSIIFTNKKFRDWGFMDDCVPKDKNEIS